MRDRAGQRPPGPARLQQASEEDTEADLPGHDGLDRLLGDQDLLLRLQLCGYAEEEWLPVAQEFARYGLAVLQPWIGTGVIFGKVHARTGFRLPSPPEATLDSDAANELAVDTIVVALCSFLQNVLKQNKWDPQRGASLKTYFIGKCLWEFPNIYKAWRRRANRWGAVRLEGEEFLAHHSPAIDGPEAALVRHEEARAALNQVTKAHARQAFVLQELGYSLEEIATELSLPDAKAVENLLGYQRRRAQTQRKRGA